MFTALIEASKAPIENPALVEYLVRASAVVRYKTIRHRRTALDWAKQMKYGETARILELGGIVQNQVVVLFQAIGCGDHDKMKAIVGDGDFFDPLIDVKQYANMELHVKLSREGNRTVRELRSKLKALNDSVENSRRLLQEAIINLENADKVLSGVRMFSIYYSC